MTAPPRITRPRPRLRRLLLGSGAVMLVFAAALLTTPWWWPHAARSLLARQGVTFARFETHGYARFALHDVRFANTTRSTTASVARLEADTPLVWLFRGLLSQPGPVEIHKWSVTLHPTSNTTATPNAPSTIDSWPALQSQLSRTLATLEKWLPEARATDGTVLFNKQKLTAASLDWLARDARLTATGLTFREHTARAELRWHDTDRRLAISASTDDSQWSAQLDTQGNRVTGRLHLWAQPLDLRATFPARCWIPTDAELTAPRLAIPGATFNLADYYPSLVTEGRLTWQNARLSLALNATGQPRETSSAPPLQLALAGQGDTDSFSLDRVDIELPGTSARLLAPIVIDRDARIRSGPSQFSVSADLEKLPGIKNLRGKIAGRVLVEPTSGGEPRLIAKLEASRITAPDLDLKSAILEAEQIGQALTLKNARLAFADGSEADLQGIWSWREKTLTAGKLEADIKPAAFARWLPPSLTFSRLKLSAEASGRWPDLQHSGKLSLADLVAGTPHPISASAEWTGTGPATETLAAEIKTADTSASLKGRLTRNDATLDSLTLTLPDAPALTLAQPARLRWQPSLSIENLDLVGGAARLSLAWSTLHTRSARIELAGLRSEWLRDFLPANWPRWQLESATLEGRWPEGPFEGTTRVLGQIEISKNKNARIELAARAQTDGLRIDRLLVSDETGSVLEARGAAPLIITPATAPFWKLDPNSRWSLTADTTPGSPFWIAQAEASGIQLRSPRLSARIEGSVKKPDARLSLQADQIAFDRIRLPTLSQLDARLVLDAGRVDLEKLSLLVAGQPLSASGRTLVPADQWPAILRDPRLLWTGDAEAKLNLPRVEIAALTAFLPDAFAPTGTLQGNLTVRASGDIEGTLKLQEASTHPIIPFGSFNQISGEIVFTGRQADLKSLTALASGQAIKASGSIAFPANNPLKVDLSLAGKNLPLARQTGLLIRGDLDIKVKSADDGLTTLSGDVNLHDSLFLRDVRSLIPKRGGGAASRPPYFSVTKAPFRDWRLALTVGGNRFITLRTPLLNGVVSGRFQLGGTLFEPIAIGQATFDEGIIVLPFAALRLTSGSVRLTQADPYSPQLAINAASRTLGYDIRMELSGPASDPALTFSSSPSLSSEQVLLMVMAGEPPRTDIASTANDRAASIGVYLGKSLLSDFFGDPSSASRFTFSSGADVSRSGKETLEAEYTLDERWSLVGERDEFDDYNAGIKLRILTSKKKPETDAQKP